MAIETSNNNNNININTNPSKPKIRGINNFYLKIIGYVLMILDHIGLFFTTEGSLAFTILRNIGRIALPIFIFLTVEGSMKTKHPIRYLLLLGIQMIIYNFIGYMLMTFYFKEVETIYIGNIFTDLFLGASMCLLLKKKNKFSFLAIIPFTIYLISCFRINVNNIYIFPFLTDYGFLSLFLFIGAIGVYFLSEYLTNKELKPKFEVMDKSSNEDSENDDQNDEYYQKVYKESLNRKFTRITTLIFLAIYALFSLFGRLNIPYLTNKLAEGVFYDYGMIAIIFIFFYNGERGYDNKIVRGIFYSVYPAHLIILIIIYSLVNFI